MTVHFTTFSRAIITIAEAMKKRTRKAKGKRIDPKNLLRTKPFDWGHGTQGTSKEVDETLHGIR